MEYRINTESSKTSDKISEAYSNLESMRIAINNLKKNTVEVNLKSTRINESLNYSGNYHLPDNDLIAQKMSQAKSPIVRNNSQLTHTNSNRYIHMNNNNNADFNNNTSASNSLKKQKYNINNNIRSNNSSSHNVLSLNPSSSINRHNIDINGLNEKTKFSSNYKDLNISTSSIHNYRTLDNIEKEFEFLKEEYESSTVTNRILNKSNIDLKNQIKLQEKELNSKEADKMKIIELNKIIEVIKNSNRNAESTVQDSVELIESLKILNNELNQDNYGLKIEIGELNNAFIANEKEINDLKKNIENYDLAEKTNSENIYQINQQLCIIII